MNIEESRLPHSSFFPIRISFFGTAGFLNIDIRITRDEY